MRVAVYGGSFNPPHLGHAMVAAWLLWADLADQVWLVPTFKHAFGKDLAPFLRRVALCEALAEAVGPRVKVCTVESELPSPSYTIDTLNRLREHNPDRTFRLVIGADVLSETERWKDWSVLEARYPPIVVGRQGYPSPPGTISFPGVSSTEVRARIASGQPIEHLVPRGVLRLIGNLYQSSKGPSDSKP